MYAQIGYSVVKQLSVQFKSQRNIQKNLNEHQQSKKIKNSFFFFLPGVGKDTTSLLDCDDK